MFLHLKSHGRIKMASALDVAKYILQEQGEMTAMKLQKLVYYAQAWSLVWDEQPIFEEKIEAWANGPVVRELYDAHRGRFRVDQGVISNGDSRKLTEKEKSAIDVVLDYYGAKDSQWLSDLTHAEQPWKQSRKNCPPGTRSNHEITLASMAEYYSAVASGKHGKKE